MPHAKHKAIHSTIPDWLPNWQDASQYPDPKKTSRSQWAWEFLRRNPQYQRLWQIIMPDRKRGLDFLTAIQNAHELGKFDDSIKEFSVALVSKFGLATFPPPASSPKLGLLFEHQASNYYVSGENLIYDEVMGEVKDTDILIKFDLTCPINIQIENAERSLKAQRERLVSVGAIKASEHRSNHKHYCLYLRVMDGHLSGASYREIADIIYPNDVNKYPEYPANKKVRDSIAAAVKLRDGDFRFITTTG